jgi:dihydroorotase-like cyclic amidohydrolase
MQNDVSSKASQCTVECYQYMRLRQHYEAALRRWEQIELVSNKNGFLDTSANRLALEVWYKAQEERNAAKKRMTLHKQSCSICSGIRKPR